MASVNPHTRELVFKLVFYGPGLGGKTTTLQYIYASAKPEHRGKMVSLATPTDRTLYFDFLPLRVPKIRGMSVRLQLFTVPGQVYYAATRKLVLSGADGVVFVADSQAGRSDVNQESLDDLHANLAEHARTLDEVPHTFHWNKRDLSDLLSIEELEARFNKFEAPSLPTVATSGEGVFEGLERITRLVLKSYEGEPQGQRLVDAGVAEAMRSLVGGAPADAGSSTRLASDRRGSPSGTSLATASPSGTSLAAASAASPAPPAVAPSVPADAERRRPTDPPDTRAVGASRPSSSATSAPPSGIGVSFADLWPEAERESVRQAEAMLGARDAVNAVLACDVLVTRVLAAAAAFVGTLDAPRDPAVVALLLRLDGARYFAFRSVVRAARHRESVSMKDALECYAFALEARRARDQLRSR